MNTLHEIVDLPETNSRAPSPATVALIVAAIVASGFLIGLLVLAWTMWPRGDEEVDPEAVEEAAEDAGPAVADAVGEAARA
jgi:hypothetical protein